MKNNLKYFASDFKAGVTVFLVAIPLCLGISMASGAPVLSGLIAGIIGGIVVGFFSKSQVSVSGPAAGLVAIMLAANAELGSYNMVLTALLISGIIQIGLGYIKAGVIAHYIPQPVIKGMLAAIGIILILKQIPHAIGYDKVYEGSVSFFQNDGENTFSQFLSVFSEFSTGALIVSAVSFFLLYVFSRKKVSKLKFFKFIPASLVVIVVGSAVNKWLMIYYPGLAVTGEHLVRLPDFSGGITNSMVFPDFSGFQVLATCKHAVIIALVASIETLLCIEATDKLDPHKRVTPTNRELKAQGIGNFISGLIGGLPVTSVIVRSSVNIENKAETKASTIIHGVLLVVSIFLARPLINMIPLASLACILIVIGYKLTHKKIITDMLKKGINQFLPFVTTVGAILLTDLLTGVMIGLGVSVFMVLRNYYMVKSYHLEETHEGKDCYKITFSEYTTFLCKPNLQKSLGKIPANAEVEFDFTPTELIDHEVREMLEDYYIFAEEHDIKIILRESVKKDNVLQFNFVHKVKKAI